MRSITTSFLVAVQFLTRFPVVRGIPFGPHSLAQAAAFFPVIGLLIAAGGVAINLILSPYASRSVVVVLVLVYLVTVTGALHEDGLADAADGFGGGWRKDRILAIMRDSRIGSFGAIAITLSILARFAFLGNLPPGRFNAFLIAGQVLSRWTALPLAYFLQPARAESGQGRLVAEKISGSSLAMGSFLTVVISVAALGTQAAWVLPTAAVMTAACALYYRRRIGGVTGDCLGATNQLTEVTVYLMGVLSL